MNELLLLKLCGRKPGDGKSESIKIRGSFELY